jgi:hypothetical protein
MQIYISVLINRVEFYIYKFKENVIFSGGAFAAVIVV